MLNSYIFEPMRFLRYLILCLLATSYGYSKSNVTKIDSLKTVLQKCSQEEKSKIWIQLAHQYALKHPDSTEQCLDAAIKDATNPNTLGDVYFDRSQYFRYVSNIKEASKSIDSAIKYYTGTNDSLLQEVLLQKVIISTDIGAYKEAINNGYKLIELNKKIGNKNNELYATLQLGYVYDRMGEYENALKWYNVALKIKGVDDNNIIGKNYGLIGIAYDELKDFKKAIHYNKIAISYFLKQNSSSYLTTWYSNLGNTYYKMGLLDSAEKYTLLGLKDYENTLSVTKINLANIYTKQNKFKKAKIILDTVLNQLEHDENPQMLSECYYAYHNYYKAQNQFKQALDYYEKYKLNEDQRLSKEKVEQINALTIQYETAEKERKILDQQAKIVQHNIALKNRNLWIGGLILLILIISLIAYFIYKHQVLKSKQQRLENEMQLALERESHQNRLQEQKLSISRDLHDNIGAQLSFIVSAMDTIKYYFKNNEITAIPHKLQAISTFAKETIQELRDTIWAMNKHEIPILELKSRIANLFEKANLVEKKCTMQLHIDQNIADDFSFNSLQGLNIFRIIQEALNNALKYAEASQINVKIEKKEKELICSIIDNGKGFNEQHIEPGNGLNNMRKRAAELNGSLQVLSVLNQGTHIILQIKLA